MCFQTGVELELVEQTTLLDWLADNYNTFGTVLEIVSDKTSLGTQYVRGFGGIGGEFIEKCWTASSTNDIRTRKQDRHNNEKAR